VIRLESVRKQYPNGRVAVESLSLEVPTGEVCILVGPSGCGKTTVLRMINRLIEPTGGRILVDDEDVLRMDPVHLRRRIGYVIQQVGLFPHQTVATNIATVPKLLGWDKARTRARVEELLELVGLDPDAYRDVYPSELSGGQRQRVGVARALAADPPIMLMDEPFGAIDPITRTQLQDEFLRLQERIRKTIVFVTHDIDEAVKMGDRIAILQVGGHLAQYDTPDAILGAPTSDFVADFVGRDRAVKRLRIVPLTQLTLRHPPIVADEIAARDAVRGGHDDAMAIVRDGDRPRLLLAGADGPLTPPVVDCHITVEDALSQMLESRSEWAVVTNGDDDSLAVVGLRDLATGYRSTDASGP
jgi:osmoprotectant transport system ATP-binding protein